MTPGLGVGANTALQDAQILAQNLAAGMQPVPAVADYERQMHGYAWKRVEESLERFNADDAVYKPGIAGWLATTLMRTGMRFVNAVPPIKKKVIAKMFEERDTTE